MTSIAQIIPPNVGGPCISVSSGPAKIAEPVFERLRVLVGMIISGGRNRGKGVSRERGVAEGEKEKDRFAGLVRVSATLGGQRPRDLDARESPSCLWRYLWQFAKVYLRESICERII